MSKVLTVGVFDLFHYGHKKLFERAKALAGKDDLIVAVQDEKVIKKYKPQAKIIYTTAERMEMVEQCRFVDKVIIYDDVNKIVRNVNFDIFVLGPDQNHQGFQAAIQYCKENDKQVVVLPRTEGISSSTLRDRLKDLK